MLDNLIKFLSEHGWITYSTAHGERTRREINAKFADAKADIDHRVATVAPMVNVKTEDNVRYIFDYSLPDADPETGEPISVVYNPTCLYIGGQIAE